MNSHSTLITIGQFDLKLKHLLIIGILSLSFSISFLIRSQPAEWGWELNEFDPFFNYRATEYVIENGFDAYFQWHDDLSWYPHGRDVSLNSQVVLHLTAATTYWIFGGGSNLYDFTILFPAVIGSLTCVVIFALVRVIGGTTAGLFSSLLFSISFPIIIRGQIGWFKSEPLGLFFGILGIYFFLSGINSKNHKIAILKLISSGIILIFGISAWGGNQFFIIPLGIFFLILPFVRKDHKFLLWSIPVFTGSFISTSLVFERLGTSFVSGMGGLSLIIPTLLLICCIVIQAKSNEHSKRRNGVIFIISLLLLSMGLLVANADSNVIPLPSFRYLNAINPFLTTTNPLVDSVSEHATTSIEQSFIFHTVLMIFSGLGIWLLLKNPRNTDFIKNDMIAFSLILGLLGVYIASAFLRLEVFAAISMIIFSSLGLSILFKEIFLLKTKFNQLKSSMFVSSFTIGIIIFLIIPFILPSNATIFTLTDIPPTILNGGTNFKVTHSDWLDSLEWIKNNTPKDAVVASWWDYGYWIQTKADRASIADNSTLSTEIIEKLAKIFVSTPDDGWESLQKMEADYFVLFIAGQRLNVDANDGQPLYGIYGGGDESKKQWFMRIAGEPLGKYLHSDGMTGTTHFWENTLLGKMIPFSPVGYLNFETQSQSLAYQPGFTPIYKKDIKFPVDEEGPLKLVYTSPSFDVEQGGYMTMVLVYEINENYVPAT